MLNDMYNVWVQCQDDGDASTSNQGTVDTENDFSSSQTVSLTACLVAIKDSVSSHHQYNEALTTLVSQLGILLKASEPTRSHANDLLEVLMSSEFMTRDVDMLQHLSQGSSLRPTYRSACSVALALLADSEHLLSSSSIDGSYLSECGDRAGGAEGVSVYDAAALYYYSQATPSDHPNPIACMQLGVKCLRGGHCTESTAAQRGEDATAALEWFRRAALLQNPIAQHKMGFFHDEGLPGVCAVDVMEAVRWYSQAAELMPDSMHNLAKIYEDGRCVYGCIYVCVCLSFSVCVWKSHGLSSSLQGRIQVQH